MKRLPIAALFLLLGALPVPSFSREQGQPACVKRTFADYPQSKFQKEFVCTASSSSKGTVSSYAVLLAASGCKQTYLVEGTLLEHRYSCLQGYTCFGSGTSGLRGTFSPEELLRRCAAKDVELDQLGSKEGGKVEQIRLELTCKGQLPVGVSVSAKGYDDAKPNVVQCAFPQDLVDFLRDGTDKSPTSQDGKRRGSSKE